MPEYLVKTEDGKTYRIKTEEFKQPEAPFKLNINPELNSSLKAKDRSASGILRNLQIGGKNVTDLVDPALITAGEGIGSLAGHPWLGAAIGSLAGQGIHAISPATFGESRQDSVFDNVDLPVLNNPLTKAAVDASISRLVTRGAKPAGVTLEAIAQAPANVVRRLQGKPTVHPIYDALFDYFTKPEKMLTSPATRDSILRATPRVDMTVGDVTGSDTIKRIEATFGRESKEKLVQKAHTTITDEVRPFYDYDTGLNVQVAADASRKLNETISTNVRNAYEALDTYVSNIKSPVYYTPTRGFGFAGAGVKAEKPIEGPIILNKSHQFAREVTKSVREAIGLPEGGNIPLAEGPLNKILANLEPIANPKQYFKDPQLQQPLKEKVASFNRIKALRDAIDDALGAKDWGPNTQDFRNRVQGALLGLRSRITKDIEETADLLWPAEAKNALKAANTIYKDKIKRFDNDLARKLLRAGRDPDLAYTDAAKTALSSPERAQQWIAATGDRKILGELYTSDIIKNSMFETPTGWIFDGSKALDTLNSTKGIGRATLDSATRANLEHFFRRAAAIDPQITQSMATAVQIRGASTALNMAGNLGTAMATGNVPGTLGTGLTILGFITRTSDFTKKVLLNPKYSRLATEGLKAKPDGYFTKAFLAAMKGTQIWAMTPEGQVPAFVSENGSLSLEQ